MAALGYGDRTTRGFLVVSVMVRTVRGCVSKAWRTPYDGRILTTAGVCVDVAGLFEVRCFVPVGTGPCFIDRRLRPRLPAVEQ